jgi:hypothetical protein
MHKTTKRQVMAPPIMPNVMCNVPKCMVRCAEVLVYIKQYHPTDTTVHHRSLAHQWEHFIMYSLLYVYHSLFYRVVITDVHRNLENIHIPHVLINI